MPKPRVIDWNHLVTDLAVNCGNYHDDYYEGEKFSGPGLHFHRRAVCAKEEEKAEMVYAVLAAWGMHRTDGGPQMNEFAVFSASLREFLPVMQSLRGKNIATINKSEFNVLENVFENLDAMRSSRKIVALSRILAHYLPDIVSPVDDNTSRFIFGKPFIPDACNDFGFFRDIHFNLIRKVATHKRFMQSTTHWLNNPCFAWDTSLPRIVHNLIMGKIVVDKKDIV